MQQNRSDIITAIPNDVTDCQIVKPVSWVAHRGDCCIRLEFLLANILSFQAADVQELFGISVNRVVAERNHAKSHNQLTALIVARSEERRVGKECVSTCR